MNNLLMGVLAGTTATAPMTMAMEWMHRNLPWRERYALPPRQIIENLTHKIGVREHLNSKQRFWLSLVSHFGYGGAAGAIFAPVATRIKMPATATGILFGLCVWTGSYLGLLPSLGLLSRATKHPLRRNLLMIVAHVIWGATLGGLIDLYKSDGRRNA